jgi:hypothetical protein
LTTDGGKHGIIAENQGFGYASCVQYVPKSNGKGLVSVGFQDCIIPLMEEPRGKTSL